MSAAGGSQTVGGGPGEGVPELFSEGCLPFPCQEWEERRRQNIEKMNEEMEKIAEYERSRRVSSEDGGGDPCLWS